MDTLLQDVRYALRSFARRPLLVVGAVLSLTVGIGATTLVFGVLNGVLLKRVPGVTRPERLVEIARSVGGTTADVTFPMYRHLREEGRALEDIAAFALEGVSISAGAGAPPEAVGAMTVTESYFELLGVRAVQGRVFSENEARFPGVAPVAVISDHLWRTHFGSRPDVVGLEIGVNGTELRIIGVLPQGFAGHHTGLLSDIFIPMGVAVPGLASPTVIMTSGSSVEMLGRLTSDISPTDAERSLSQIADAFARASGGSSANNPYSLSITEWGPLPAAVRTAVRAFLGVLLLLAALALAMACLNVSTILVARASERQRELAVRRAIGATPGRLVRQMVTEVGVLFVIAGAIGAGTASYMSTLFGELRPPVALPGRMGADIGTDITVWLFAFGVTLLSALAFTLIPARSSSRFDLVSALKSSGASDGKSRLRFRSVLVGAQMALTSVLLGAMLLFGRALSTMRSLNTGWDGNDVLVASIDLEMNGTSSERGLVAQRQMLEALNAIPGVDVASMASKLPIGGRSSFGLVQTATMAPRQGLNGEVAYVSRASSGYFRTMRIPLLSGRDFALSDDETGARVAIVNQTMARRLWPRTDAVGQTFTILGQGDTVEVRVIGIVADAQLRSPGEEAESFYYVSAAQWYNSSFVLHVRSHPGLSGTVASTIPGALRSLDPSLPVASVSSLNEAMSIYLMPQRLASWMSGAMALFGLLLASVGIYGTTSFLVSRRSRDMAIRSALGARNKQLVGLIVLQGSRAPAIGVTVGLVLTLILTIGASKAVVGARPADPLVLLTVPLVLAVSAALSMLTPIRRLVRAPLAPRLGDD